MKKTTRFLSVVLACMMLIVGCKGSESTKTKDSTEKPSETTSKEKANVVIWYWGGDLPVYAEWFNENNPNITIEVVPTPHDEYYQKIATSIATGGDLPDIVAFEASFRQQIINLEGAWEDLEKEPYLLNRDELFDYTLSQIVTDSGTLVSTEMGMTPACVAYKRDMTKEFFGVETPEELAVMFPTWESMLEKSKALNDSTNGEVFMFADANDILNMVRSQQKSPIVNKAGDIDEGLLENVLSLMLKSKENLMYDPKIYTDGNAKNATFSQDYHIFYANPVWGPEYIIKPNDPDSNERWGMMDAPGGNFSMGGCSLGITSTSEVKEAAWAFIKTCFVSVEGAKHLANTTGALSVWKPVYDIEPEVFKVEDPYFGGQDITSKFIDIARHITVNEQTKYDSSLNAALAYAMELMIYEDADLDTMKAETIKLLKDDIAVIQ